MTLINDFEDKKPRALAKMLSALEGGKADACELSRYCYLRSGKAHVVGVTGPPGVGKSTLIDLMIGKYREGGLTVGVVAVDPASPFSGGALLGDRIRMNSHWDDPGVFIRSMSTRGRQGGVSGACGDAIMCLDAYGFDRIIVETVGVGQDQVDIARLAQTVVVVLMPELGDEIQNFKAGILEIAHVFVINKSDLPGFQILESALRMLLESDTQTKAWTPAVVKTTATAGHGMTQLMTQLDLHREHVVSEIHAKTYLLSAAKNHLLDTLKDSISKLVHEKLEKSGKLEKYTKLLAERKIDPCSAVQEILADFNL